MQHPFAEAGGRRPLVRLFDHLRVDVDAVHLTRVTNEFSK